MSTQYQTTTYDGNGTVLAAYEEYSETFKPIYSMPTFAHMTKLQGAKVIDFGCADGAFLRECLRRGADYCLGFDLSEDLITKGLEAPENQPFVKAGKLDLRVADCLKPQDQYESIRTFDYAVSQHVVHYAEHDAHLEIYYNNIFRALKPGGELILVASADPETPEQQAIIADLVRIVLPLQSQAQGKDPYFSSVPMLVPMKWVKEGKAKSSDVLFYLDSYSWTKEKLIKKLIEVGFNNVHSIDRSKLVLEDERAQMILNNPKCEINYFIAGQKPV